MAKKGSGKHKKDPGKKQKASRSPQGKQRQERRDGWTTRRRRPASMEFDTDSDSESDCDSEPEPQSDSESESEPGSGSNGGPSEGQGGCIDHLSYMMSKYRTYTIRGRLNSLGSLTQRADDGGAVLSIMTKAIEWGLRTASGSLDTADQRSLALAWRTRTSPD
ncbi:hypothetical protein QJQ45_004709 [Haematococcus lacustris]|nr:hypothetical protein QJQ45_004709 [Haematococcus lacustris]